MTDKDWEEKAYEVVKVLPIPLFSSITFKKELIDTLAQALKEAYQQGYDRGCDDNFEEACR